MDFTYVIILAVVLLVSPFVLRFASNQRKETKQQLRFILLGLLFAQLILGFFAGVKFFLAISFIQILLLIIGKSFNTLVIVLNFVNSVVIFAEMINMSKQAGYQIFSLPAIGAVFLVLIGNILGLVLINRDKNLLNKYTMSSPRRRGST